MTSLVYQGVPIRDRNEMLCLTDMWRATGSDPSKRPVIWRGLPGKGEFIEHIALSLKVKEFDLFEIERGRKGVTWAQWQIAFAYAHYLSPEFYAWCNEAARDRMEGKAGPILPATLTAIGNVVCNVVHRELEPVHQGMADIRRDQQEIRCEIVDMKGNLIEVVERVNKLAKPAKFSKWARKQFVYVVHKRYTGLCPCCWKVKIVDEHGREIDTKSSHTDHFHGPENNKVQDGWLVCASCNYRLFRDPAFKEKAKPHFKVFQDHRFEFFGNGKHQSPRKQRQSKTVSDSKQYQMKF